MIIGIESVRGNKRLVGKAITFDDLKNAANEIFEKENEDSFVLKLCARFGYKELPYSEGFADYMIDLDERIVYVTSHTFPATFDDAKVLYYTDRGVFEPVNYVGGAIAHKVLYLAVCQYNDDASFYIFHLDENLEVVADDCFESIETCKTVMERYGVEWHKKKEIQ